MNRFYGAAAIFVALLSGSTGISAQFQQSAGTSIQDAVKNSASDVHQASDSPSPEVLNDIGKFEIRPYISRVHENVNYTWRRQAGAIEIAAGEPLWSSSLTAMAL